MSNSVKQNNAIYAILADSVYWDVRYGQKKDGALDQQNFNWTPVPTGWKIVREESGSGDEGKKNNPQLEGFTARAYKNGNNIIIAYAGTDAPDLSGDWKNNLSMGNGVGSQ